MKSRTRQLSSILIPALASSSAAVFLLAAGRAPALAGDYDADVKICLANWKEHPFDTEAPKYRVVESQVKVMGIGGNVREDTPTPAPELVYVRPSVSVWSSQTMDLLNPNGWYCLRSNVSVMAKAQINLHCKAQLASTSEGTNVMGGGDEGINVMGATVVARVGCD